MLLVALVCLAMLAAPAGTAQGRGHLSKRLDRDRDGLSNRYELRVSRTNPRKKDTDRDGLSDYHEVYVSHTSPRKKDTDGDGLSDRYEVRHGMNPRDRKDPRKPGSTSVPVGTPAPVADPPPTLNPPALAPDTSFDSGPSGTVASPSATFSFSSPQPLTSFECSLDGGAWSACSSPQAYSDLGQGAHTFGVRARDVLGDVDPTPATRSWTVDTVAPDTTIGSGPSGTTDSTSASFTFSSSEPGSTFQCKLDSGSWKPCTSPQTYSSLADGSHTFKVRATDAAGNRDGSPASRTWTVSTNSGNGGDTTAPDTTITSAPSDTSSSSSATFEFSSSEPGSTFECQLDGADWGNCSSPQTYSGLADGSHTFSVRATDAAGNADPSPASATWTIGSSGGSGGITPTPTAPPPACTSYLSAGANVSTAVKNAAAGATICLHGGAYPRLTLSNFNKGGYVTVRSADGETATMPGVSLQNVSFIQVYGLRMTDQMEVIQSGHDIEFTGNELGPQKCGMYFYGWDQAGAEVSNVLVDGNYIHDIDYPQSQGQDGCDGYGIQMVANVRNFTIRNNTIKSVAEDYLQTSGEDTFTVEHNLFLGPGLSGSHPQAHADLWQIFGGGSHIRFTNNVARNTGTAESLLFQEGAFSDVVIDNNLFDHDSNGYTAQLYNASGLQFTNNTVVGSRWGVLFRDYQGAYGQSGGSGYDVQDNIVDCHASDGCQAIGYEGSADKWGTYDYNVSTDGSAWGPHSIKNWKASWADTTNYLPLGLPFAAGYRVP